MEITTGLIVDLGGGNRGVVAGVLITPIAKNGEILATSTPSLLLPELLVPSTEHYEPAPETTVTRYVRRFKDTDGDIWKETAPSSGRFECYHRNGTQLYAGVGTRDESNLKRIFGPLTPLDDEPFSE